MNRSSTSPFRGTTSSNRPQNQGNGTPESFELIIRSLQRQNNSLVQEINLLKNKTKKVADLQDKIDLVLKHNNQLLSENQKLAKIINQKKSEVDVWKSKFDTLSVNKSASSQLQNRRLLNEIQKLKEQITDVEHVKNLQISELKNEHHLQIQSIKRSHLNNNQKYELQIRKLKEYCEKKEYEISDLNMKFVRLNKETDFQIGKLREEKERLRGDLLYEQSQHKKEVDGLKNKFQYNFHSQIQNLKKQHLNQIEALDYQNCKLKEVINSKNMEIQSILAKNQKIKNNYEDSLSLLKKENEDLKDKLIETQHIGELELNNLKEKLDGMRQSELSLLKNAHENQLDLLNRQINKLQEIIDLRNREMDQFQMERKQMRNDKENQIINCKAELQNQININKDLIIRYDEKLRSLEYDLKCKEEELQTTQSYLESQIRTLKLERDNINRLLESKTEELVRTREVTASEIKKLVQEVQSLRNQVAHLKDQAERQSRKSSSQIDDHKKFAELKYKQYESKIKNLTDQNQQKDRIIKELQQNLRTKQDEIKVSDLKINHLQNTEKELRRQIRQSLARWQAKERQYNDLIKNQIQSMERARNKQIQQLTSIYQNKTNSFKHQIKELQRHIQEKNKSINDLKDKYQDLVTKFEQIFGQRAAQKNLDIKVPGWLPDTLATKSLFDVFIKNKVLQYCS